MLRGARRFFNPAGVAPLSTYQKGANMAINQIFGVWIIKCDRCGHVGKPQIQPECSEREAIAKVTWCPKCHSEKWNVPPSEEEREARRLRKEAKCAC